MRQPTHRFTREQYLELERASNVKHEFYAGEIYAMSGGTRAHSLLAMALGAQLTHKLKGRRCEVYNSDLRVGVAATGLITYPDVSVACGEPRFDPKDTLINPVLLIEVLSDSTETYDRGFKFEQFQQIPSLREYVLVSKHEALIEIFRRGDRDQWMRFEARPGAVARLESVGVELDAAAVYEGIPLE